MTNRLTDTIEEQDVHFAKANGITPELCCFQKLYNPLTLFCRLMELGFDRKEALIRIKVYENYFYTPTKDRLLSINKERR